MRAERLHYIDVAKGLLICLVVLSHIPQVMMKLYGSLTPAIRSLEYLEVFYVPYFMPAFFVITGFCCNFDTKLIPFVKKQFCSIMIPAFCLGFISMWINLIQNGVTDWSMYCKLGFRTFLLYGGVYWFLGALFLAKIIYYLFCKFIQSIWGRLFLCILCILFGLLLHRMCIKEYWFITHAFMLIIFLWIGEFIRDIKISTLHYAIAGFIYVALVLIETGVGLNIPYITATINVKYSQLCNFLLISISGVVGILGIARAIKNSNILEKLGRQSLVIYCLHISLEMLFAKCFYIFSSSELFEYIFVFLLFGFTIISCLGISKLLNKQYFRFILGKF